MTTDNKQVKQNKKDQQEMFANASVDALKEIAQFMGLKEDQIPEDATKEQLITLLTAAKRHDISIARTVQVDGKDLECPPGHMIIRVTPKSAGMEWGPKSKEAFLFAVNCDLCVGRRGATVIISDKYRSCWENAVKHEYDLDGEPTPGMGPPKLIKREVPAEDVNVIYWNRDLEAERRVEQELIDNSRRNLEEKRAAKALGLADLLKSAARG